MVKITMELILQKQNRLKELLPKSIFVDEVCKKLQIKKNNITGSKCKLPVISIMINGFKAYQKMFFIGKFNSF